MFLSSNLNNLLVCGILKGVNLTFEKKYLKDAGVEQTIVLRFDEIEVLDEEPVELSEFSTSRSGSTYSHHSYSVRYSSKNI